MDFSDKSNMYKLLGIIVAIILLMILILVLVSSCTPKVRSFDYINDTIKDATIAYFNDHNSELPKSNGESKIISIDTLVSNGYMDSIENMRNTTSTECKGFGKAYNNGGVYIYSSSLNCGEDYSKMSLTDYIKENSRMNEDGSGYYDMIDPVSFGKILVFRGENPNNNVYMGSYLYKIVSMSDNYIELISVRGSGNTVYDDRYNIDVDDKTGINKYETSRLKESSIRFLNEELFGDTIKLSDYLVSFDVCTSSVSEEDFSDSGSMECSIRDEKQLVGNIGVYQYIRASLDNNCPSSVNSCENYNYLSNLGLFWSVTPVKDSVDEAYIFNFDGPISPFEITRSTRYLTVIRIMSDIDGASITGIGTESDPFVISFVSE